MAEGASKMPQKPLSMGEYTITLKEVSMQIKKKRSTTDWGIDCIPLDLRIIKLFCWRHAVFSFSFLPSLLLKHRNHCR